MAELTSSGWVESPLTEEEVARHLMKYWEERSLLVQDENERLRAVLLGYERWEADVILDAGAWPLTEVCVLSQEHLDGLMRLQSERNVVLRQTTVKERE